MLLNEYFTALVSTRGSGLSIVVVVFWCLLINASEAFVTMRQCLYQGRFAYPVWQVNLKKPRTRTTVMDVHLIGSVLSSCNLPAFHSLSSCDQGLLSGQHNLVRFAFVVTGFFQCALQASHAHLERHVTFHSVADTFQQ